MTTAAAAKKAPSGRMTAKVPATPVPAANPSPPSSRRRGFTPLTPMRVQAAKSMTRLADSLSDSHPDMAVHQHVRDAARMLRAGNEEAAQRHLRAAAFSLSPQSLMRHGLHTDDAHVAARQAVHGVHRHILLVKDIADADAKNQAAIRRDSYGDDASSPPMPQPPVHADPNAGYGPGALAQKPTARQPPGNQALNAPNRASGGGSDPAVADPVGVQPRGSKQFAYGWDDLALVIALTGDGHGHHIPGTPDVYRHGFIPIGGTVLHSDGIRRPAGAKGPGAVKSASPPKAAAAKPAPAKAAKAPSPPAKAAPEPAAAKAPETPAKTVAEPDKHTTQLVSSMNTMSSLGGKSAQQKVAKNISTSDLRAMDKEYTRQDLENGRIAAGHKVVKDELASRGETALPAPAADELAKGKAAAKAEAARPRTPEEERQDLIGSWSTSYRYRGTTESKNKRTQAFATEMHRLLSTNKQPKTCGPGCQDAHKFLTMMDRESAPQDKELTRGLALSSTAAERMFKPGKTVDMPVASWTNDDHTAAQFARPDKDGQVKVVLHAAPGAKGLDITKDSNWENESEVVSGGRFNVDRVQNQGGVMHVYVTQKDFSAH